MKKALVEFIGTFFLVLTIGLAVRSGSPLAPLAIAAGLMAVIYGGGHISGAHFNPAVTLAALIRGSCPKQDVLPYLVAQFAAALAAGWLVCYLLGAPAAGPAMHGTIPSAIVEFLFTFALAWVILNVATAKSNAGNSHYGLAIAMVVLAGAVSVGGISGGAFNPAVGVGVYVMGLESAHQLAVYFLADLAGGAAAAFAFLYLNGKE
jgi:aquaporin Z